MKNFLNKIYLSYKYNKKNCFLKKNKLNLKICHFFLKKNIIKDFRTVSNKIIINLNFVKFKKIKFNFLNEKRNNHFIIKK